MTDDQCIMISSNQRHKDTKKVLLLQVFYRLFFNRAPTGTKNEQQPHSSYSKNVAAAMVKCHRRACPWCDIARRNVTLGTGPSVTFTANFQRIGDLL